ncbi:MAG: tetratricopeptide repeat protein [Phycisphaerales bacterium]|nr:tetratricopeptide repeat protein [Phycisphaerales bacterium]
MSSQNPMSRIIAAAMLSVSLTLAASADDLRNVKRGEMVPACKLAAIDGSVIDSDALKGSVIVYVCLSAEQKRSELAAIDSQAVVAAMNGEPVKLVHLTADVVQRAYFEKLRSEKNISASLAFDADREFYGKLGLIAFPTTVIVNKDGKLDNAISLHGNDYKTLLDAHIRHALGKIDDKQLKEMLSVKPAEKSSPKTAASAHRSLARLMREKGQLDQAKAELKKGLEINNDDREAMLDLAELSIITKDYDGADAMTDKVLAIQSDHRRAKQIKGATLFNRGKLDEAEKLLTEALDLNPSPELCHYYLGEICEQRGQKDQALTHYREALKHFVHDKPPAGVTGPAENPAEKPSEKPAEKPVEKK